MAGRPKKQTVDYFPHHCTHGPAMFILEQRYGNDGYAAWFKLWELLGTSDGHFFDCSNVFQWEFLQAKIHLPENLCAEILNLLANLGEIDPELWRHRIIWSDNFISEISEVYKNRKTDPPKKPDFYASKIKRDGISTDGNPISTDENSQGGELTEGPLKSNEALMAGLELNKPRNGISTDKNSISTDGNPQKEKSAGISTAGKTHTIVEDSIKKEYNNGTMSPPDVKIFIDYAYQKHHEKTGEKLLIDGGKDGRIVKRLLGTYGLEKLKGLYDALIQSDDPFIRQAGYSIGVFKSQINKLLVQKGGPNGGFGQVPGGDRAKAGGNAKAPGKYSGLGEEVDL